MKRKMSGVQGTRLLAIFMCALILVGAALSAGAMAKADGGRGKLRVALREATYQQLPANAEISVKLYQIGIDDSGTKAGWRMYDDLKDYGVLEAETSGQLGEVAEAMAKTIPSRYMRAEQTMKSGETTFGGLDDGVYLGVVGSSVRNLRAMPFIVTIPARDPETRKIRRSYTVTIKDAYEASTPKPSATPTPTPVVTLTPTPVVTPTPTPVVTPTPTPVVTPTPTPVVTPTPTPTPTATPTATPTPPPGGPGPGRRTTNITGQKVWVDDGNAHGTRPENITVRLYANGEVVNAEPSWSNTDSDTWSFAFFGLPVEDGSGTTLTYTVKEEPVANYRSSVSGTTITNELIPGEAEDYVDLTGEKTWVDNNNARGTRPDSITVRLLRDGKEIDHREVTAETGWKFDFGRLPADDGYGNTYSYTLHEDGVRGYFSRILENTEVVNELLIPGTTTTSRYTPMGNIVVRNHNSGTPVPRLEDRTEAEMEELFDLFDYDTPLWGILGTGDETPVWPYAFGGAGALALIGAIVLALKRKKK